MEPRSLQFVVTASSGELQIGSPATRVLRVCTDSRRVQPGDLFLALPGERFDGHAYLAQAAAKGAVAAVVTSDKLPADFSDCPVVRVENTRQALGKLAAAYRNDFALPIAAVAGSNGKTTTKELVASVLKQKFATLRSEASFNNDIGVPLTLLNLTSFH